MSNAGVWCLVEIGGTQVKANIIHIGRGRYRIIEDEQGKYADVKIDASDVIRCL